MPSQASARPPTAPMAASRNASVSIWRARCHQLAPIAARTASSRSRREPRTSRRLATFAQAMSNRKITAPKSTGIEAIAPLEVFVTEDGHDGKRGRRWDSRLGYARRWGWLWYSVCIREITAEHDLGSHYTKEVRGDHCGADLLWSSIFFEQDVAESEDPREVLESVFRPIAQIDEVLVGEGEVAHVTVAHVAGGDDQAAGVLIGKRPQQHGIGDTEDRGARANAQGNGQNGSECKDRAFPQCSACECQISKRHRSTSSASARLARNTPHVGHSQALSAPPQLQG